MHKPRITKLGQGVEVRAYYPNHRDWFPTRDITNLYTEIHNIFLPASRLNVDWLSEDPSNKTAKTAIEATATGSANVGPFEPPLGLGARIRGGRRERCEDQEQDEDSSDLPERVHGVDWSVYSLVYVYTDLKSNSDEYPRNEH